MIVNYTVARKGHEFIGDAVAKALNRMHDDTGDLPKVVAIVPRMLKPYGPSDFEVNEVDMLIDVK